MVRRPRPIVPYCAGRPTPLSRTLSATISKSVACGPRFGDDFGFERLVAVSRLPPQRSGAHQLGLALIEDRQLEIERRAGLPFAIAFLFGLGAHQDRDRKKTRATREVERGFGHVDLPPRRCEIEALRDGDGLDVVERRLCRRKCGQAGGEFSFCLSALQTEEEIEARARLAARHRRA